MGNLILNNDINNQIIRCKKYTYVYMVIKQWNVWQTTSPVWNHYLLSSSMGYRSTYH